MIWEATGAYSGNIFKVMVDPATWVIAAVIVFGLRRRWSRVSRFSLALAVNGVFALAFIVWPAGESGRPYAWKAFLFELLGTATWAAIFLFALSLFGGKAESDR